MNHLSKAAASFLVVLAAAYVFPSTFATTYSLTVNGATKQGAVPHFWSRCVGTGGAQLCLDANWKAHAKIAVAEAGFQAFRGHRILTASNPITWNGSGTPTYNWNTFDQIYSFLVDTLHTVPVMELSSMPTPLQTSGEWSPPKDYSVWQDMINKLVAHCISKWGAAQVRTWIFEVWNEWDYSGFWSGGTEQNYYQLYKAAVTGAKAADSLVQVVGPATTGSGGLAGFVNYCKTNNLPYNGLSNHCYGQQGSSQSDPGAIRTDNRNRAGAINGTGKKLLSLNTEFNTSYSGQGGNTSAYCYSMDSHVNAPFVVKCVKLVLDDGINNTYQIPDVLSYWAVSDVFDEGSWYASHSTTLFGQVFGLINQQGIRKATFNAYKMLNMMGTTRLELTGGIGNSDGADGFATVSSDGSQVAVMCYNFYTALGAARGNDLVNLTINNLPLSQGQIKVNHYRVDSLHSNPYSVWLSLGKPASTNSSAMDQIRTASNLAELVPQKTFNYTGGAYTDSFTLPEQSVSLLLFTSNSTKIGTTTPLSKQGTAISLKGTVLRVTGSRGNPIDLDLYCLDGKSMKRLRISGDYCDLRQFLSKGIYLVRARVQGASVSGKIVVE
jgi:xylan 1,4-beta-xylosidase